ncbi:hypothetical protein M406DRAFT_71518 [Cryphonectria parasitica EP155]|uniref:Uncharacterized protein n=1 Tax=Cryphonectria parasitica (strain ATCC 38755 / EP155) TaxID=660469 RepID=A0A9P4Y8Y7_CRYP1|nr:uncharacterized protein M406DRAFT_71518 [Cryphonectria parasitica EP155]KAF3768522.1 hypothetical protein M406DRAFT_71518 [Cryphonectria parasitica EP155]
MFLPSRPLGHHYDLVLYPPLAHLNRDLLVLFERTYINTDEVGVYQLMSGKGTLGLTGHALAVPHDATPTTCQLCQHLYQPIWKTPPPVWFRAVSTLCSWSIPSFPFSISLLSRSVFIHRNGQDPATVIARKATRHGLCLEGEGRSHLSADRDAESSKQQALEAAVRDGIHGAGHDSPNHWAVHMGAVDHNEGSERGIVTWPRDCTRTRPTVRRASSYREEKVLPILLVISYEDEVWDGAFICAKLIATVAETRRSRSRGRRPLAGEGYPKTDDMVLESNVH